MQPNSHTKEQIGETIFLEQYLCVLHPDIHTWVKEHNPQTGEETAALAEHYTAAHRDPLTKRKTVGKPRFGEGRPYSLPVVDRKDTGVSKKPVLSNLKSNFICYYCQQPGHNALMCPLRKWKSVELCFVPHSESDDDVKDNEMIPHKRGWCES